MLTRNDVRKFVKQQLHFGNLDSLILLITDRATSLDDVVDKIQCVNDITDYCIQRNVEGEEEVIDIVSKFDVKDLSDEGFHFIKHMSHVEDVYIAQCLSVVLGDKGAEVLSLISEIDDQPFYRFGTTIKYFVLKAEDGDGFIFECPNGTELEDAILNLLDSDEHLGIMRVGDDVFILGDSVGNDDFFRNGEGVIPPLSIEK